VVGRVAADVRAAATAIRRDRDAGATVLEGGLSSWLYEIERV
jgi:hypothetical protein